MSLAIDLWMPLAKRRLIRRTVANGPYAPPAGTQQFGSVTIPAATKLRGVSATTNAFTVGQLVAFIPRPHTGSDAAEDATNQLRAVVDTVVGNTVTFSTAPTDLTGISMAGLVLDVIPV